MNSKRAQWLRRRTRLGPESTVRWDDGCALSAFVSRGFSASTGPWMRQAWADTTVLRSDTALAGMYRLYHRVIAGKDAASAPHCSPA